MSGRLPESRNIQEFQDNLFNKKDMSTEDDRRWTLDHPEVPKRSPKIHEINKLDAGFFGLHYRQADVMDPMIRKHLETAIEAVMDAGVNPSELEGTRTGVFIGACYADMETKTLINLKEPQNFGITGYLRSFLANRISYYLKLKGPSVIVDTACSSSLNALELAFKSMRCGQCDNAIVGGVNILLDPGVTIQFYRLGLLSDDGTCKVFDQNADGYVRAEAIVSVFLQKAKNAKRIYSQIVYTKVNSDGYKPQGITFPSTQMQQQLITEVFKDSDLSPDDLSFLEAHGTGTEVGDTEEVEAIDLSIGQKRKEPLLMGAVKCSIGHSEPASGLSSIVKMIFAFETGKIAPNIKLNTVKNTLTGVLEGRLKIVTEETDLDGEEATVGLNNFGFGGNNAHVLIRRFKKIKNKKMRNDCVPRLVCVSGRTKEAVSSLLENLQKRQLDEEYVALLHNLFKEDIVTHLYRGYALISEQGLIKSSWKIVKSRVPLYVFFGKIKNSYEDLSNFFYNFPVFKDTIKSINVHLSNANLKTIEVNSKNEIEYGNEILGAIALQIGIVNIIKALNLNPVAVYGDSTGKLATAYYREDITLKEAVVAAFKFDRISENYSEKELKKLLPGLKSPLVKRKYRHFFDHEDKLNEMENIPPEFITFDSFKNIPRNAIIINISDDRLHKTNASLVENGTVKFLEVLGRLYEMGHTPQLHKLYPEIEFPVSRGTPMISPLIKWNYNKDWYTYRFTSFERSNSKQMDHRIVPFTDEWKCIMGHVIDGRNLIPASEYLWLVWFTFADNHNRMMEDLPVVFEDCKFMKAVIMPSDKVLSLTVNIYSKSGHFGLYDETSLLVSGRIFSPVDIESFKTGLNPLVLDETDPTLVLTRDEIYKELNLRGYNYDAMFKGVIKSNVEASSGLIEWENNYTTFIDKMFQMKILQTDTRLLYVPVGIKRITIDPREHLKSVKGESKANFPVYVYKESNVIKSGGVEVTGLVAKPIPRRKSPAKPTIEKYEFIPNETQLTLEDSVKINLHIMLENTLDINFKAVEIPNKSNNHFMPLISQILEDVPFMKPDLTLFADSVPENISGVKVEYFDLNENSNLTLIVGTNIIKESRFKKMFNTLNQNGFILTREDSDFIPEDVEGFNVLTQHAILDGKLILLQKIRNIEITKFIEISSNNFDWLPPLQQAIKNKEDVIIYSQNEELEGIMGLVNSIRREPGGNKVRCFFITHQAPKFDPKSEFYRDQIKKNFAINVYKDSKWGTYRHLLLEEPKEVECEQILANTIVRGDLSTLRWIQGPLTTKTPIKPGHTLVHNYYSGLNFKDVILASGRISVDVFANKREDQEFCLGMEFAGRDVNGKRVAGMLNDSSLTSLLASDFIWEVPEEWSMEEAATMPVVYCTVIYSLLKVVSLKPGSSILIHSATGGVGIAALHVCLYHKCEVFVTVGTEEKRDFVKRHFPQIPDNHIGNSRDVTFEDMIKRETKGRGVDFVLNSIIGEKLFTSIRCLKRGGSLLEIGKYDLVNDNRLQMMLLEKEISYYGISLDRLTDPTIRTWLRSKICEGIKLGFVKPLPRTVFDKDELDKAFRHLTTGKHVGKVVIKIRDEEHEQTKPVKTMFKGLPRFSCDPDKCYIIVGGLGGFGLELTDWLVLRGARKVVLVTSSGLKTGYQSQRLRIWRSYGANIQISTSNVTTKEGCFQLLQEAAKLGPIDGIFNLAAVLRDSLFTDQTEEKFRLSLAPKACTTKYLDEHSRILCPNLRHFVVFSSISCGRGNPGQSNYAMANSIMERICERRKKDGLPGLAIQWGAIAEVGLVANMQKGSKEQLIGGTLPQKVSSCLEVLDRFLNQDNPIVSSMIIAQESKRDMAGKNVLDAIGVVLGVKNIKSLDPNTTLVELGMDSITGTEIVNMLEKCYDITVTAKDVRNITIKRVLELEAEKKGGTIEKKFESENDLFIQFIPKGGNDKSTIINIPSQVKENEKANTVFVFPGIEGTFELLEPITKNLKAHLLGVQYGYDSPKSSVQEIAQLLLPYVENNIGEDKVFRFIGYSFGVIVALEVIVLLEKKGYSGIFVAIEGSPRYQSASGKKLLPEENEDEFQTSLIFKLVSMASSIKFTDKDKEKFLKCENFDKRLDLALSMVDVSKYERIEKQAAVVLYKHFKAAINYTFDHEKIKTKVNLFKAKYPVISDIQEDYEFSAACQHVDVATIDGDHVTVLKQQQLSDDINRLLN